MIFRLGSSRPLVAGMMPLLFAFSSGLLLSGQEVEGQPLAANVQRLLKSFQQIGARFPVLKQQDLRDALLKKNPDEIIRLLDPYRLLTVTINPEERVSVKTNQVKPFLNQGGHRAFLVKIINQSGSTAELNVRSPQAGPVYADPSLFSLKRQQQPELAADSKKKFEDTFFDVRFYHQPPMKPLLSGLEIEYAILLCYSSQAGKREATISFDIGSGTKDLGERHQAAILFDIRPAERVRFKINDPSQMTLSPFARVLIEDQSGNVYPPQAKRLAPDFFFQPHIYRKSGESLALPPGEYRVSYWRGPEYLRKTSKLIVLATGNRKPIDLNLDLQRWIDPNFYGFYSGDHHIHAAGCAHYNSPTKGVTPEDMFRQVAGEGLNFGCILTWGPCFDFQKRFFKPEQMHFSHAKSSLKYDLEISGFGSQALGHVCLLNLQDQTYPGSEGTSTKGWPTWTTPVMKWAKDQGGVTGYAHSASGLAIDAVRASQRILQRMDKNQDGKLSNDEVGDQLLPFSFQAIDSNRDEVLGRDELVSAHRKAANELPNHAIPEMNGVGAMEICVSSVAGVCDFISAMDTARIQEWNTWYHLLNCGFPIKVSGETDFPCMSSRRVGAGRVYVFVDKEELPDGKLVPDFETWIQGVAKGRSYVSDGYAHAIDFDVDGSRPGFGTVRLDRPGTVKVSAKVAFAPQMPETVAQGTVKQHPSGRVLIGDTVQLNQPRSRQWVKGGKRLVEIVLNGNVIARKNVLADGKVHHLKFDVPVQQSSWVALRQFPQLHTNPVNILVKGKPIRASRRSAQWCYDMTKLLWQNRFRVISPEERPAAERAFQKTYQALKKIEEESTTD